MADRFDLLRVHGRLAPIGPAHNIRSRPLEPLLHAIRLQSLQNRLPPTTQLAFRAGSNLPRAPHELRHRNTPTPKYALDWKIRPAPFSAVPQLWYRLGLPGFDLTGDERAQFAISIAVTCVGRTITVASAAERLGAPKHASARITSTWKHLCEQTGWPTLRQAILRASVRLTHDPPAIDYASRRRALSSPAQLDLLARESSLKASFTDPERLWIWCHFTRASLRHGPHPEERPQCPPNFGAHVTPPPATLIPPPGQLKTNTMRRWPSPRTHATSPNGAMSSFSQ